MPAVVEWKGMICSIRYLNILFQPNNSGRKPQVICHDPLYSTALLCGTGSCIWFLLNGVQQHVFDRSILQKIIPCFKDVKKLPHPRSYHIPGILTECLVTFSAANLGLKSYWNLSDLNFQLLALLLLSPCDWRAFRTLYILPGKVLTHCNQLNLNLFDELNRSRFFSLSLQGCFYSSSTVIFVALSCTVTICSTFNISFSCSHLPPRQLRS